MVRDREKHALLTDEAIVELYFERNESAIKETERKYGKYLYAIAYNILASDQDCEECLNDTYLKVWNAIPPARPKSLRTYISKIIRNRAVDRYDEQTRMKRVPADACDPLEDFEGIIGDSASPEDELEAKRIGEMITAYADTLSDRRMYIFVSRFYYAKPLSEIAKKLRVSLSTVNKELFAMKKELRAILEDGGIEIE